MMLDSIMSSSSSWWLTPTSLFLLLNLVIGTIAITTRYSSHRKLGHQHQQLGRVPAMIDRVKSINFSLHKFPFNLNDGTITTDHHLLTPTMEPGYSGNANSPPQLARVGSFLDRVKSVNFSRFRFQSYNLDADSEFVESEHENRVDSSLYISDSGYRSIHKESDPDESLDLGHRVQANATPQLARVPSFLDRVKAVNFPRYKFPSYNDDTEPEFLESENENRVDPFPPLSDRVKTSLYRSDSSDRSESDPEESSNLSDRVHVNPPPPLARVPSFLDRVKSINFPLYKFPSDKLDTEFLEPEHEIRVDADEYSDLGHRDYVKRTKSEHNETHAKRVLPEKMKKSASEKFGYGSKSDEDENVERQRPQTAREEKTATFGGDVDAKADDFINKFKQQLKLQRLDSLLRYRGK